MRLQPRLLVLGLVVTAACSGAASKQAAPATVAAPASKQPPPPVEPAPAEPAEPATLESLLGAGHPEHVHVVAIEGHGQHGIVLYTLDVGERWSASRPPDDPVLAQLEEGLDACEDMDDYGYKSCREAAAGEAGIPEALIFYFSEPDVRAWELAHVEFDQAGPGRVLHRKRLLDYGIAVADDTALAETQLEVHDMDGDQRPELTVVFSVALPRADILVRSHAAVGFVLDAADLHVQFATTRNYHYEASDLSFHLIEIETTWLARDENGDGYSDLVVRERSREYDDPGEADPGEPPREESRSRSTVCLYELAGDRWVCREALGTEVIDGSKLVETATVP